MSEFEIITFMILLLFTTFVMMSFLISSIVYIIEKIRQRKDRKRE